MRLFGYILFITGVIFASVFAVPQKPLWGYFSIFILSAFAGALLVRFAKSRESLSHEGDCSDADESTEMSLYSYLIDIYERTGNLVNLTRNDQTTSIEIKKAIEEIQKRMKHFIDGRFFIQNKYGIKNMTGLYSSFAGGERYLSRAWSALVDGHWDEMKMSLKKSESRFSGVVELFKNMIARISS